MQDFPRASGKAKKFHALKDLVIDWGYCEFVHKYAKEALAELHDRGCDLVYGDRVKLGDGYRNVGILIFDGKVLVPNRTDGTVEYGGVPKEFTVISHELTDKYIPVNYYDPYDIINVSSELLLNKEWRVEIDHDTEYYVMDVSEELILCSDHDVDILNKMVLSGDIITASNFWTTPFEDPYYEIRLSDEELTKYQKIELAVKAPFT